MTNLKHWTRWFKKKTPGKKLSPKTGKTEAGYTYVMSDLHGCFDELNAMLAKIGFSDQDKLILAGDYIDRGSQNYEMLCWMEQVPQNILLLRGNHEEEFLCYLELLLAVQEKRQLVIDESSSKDLEHLYQETKNLIEQHNRQTEQIRVFDHYGTLEELITEQCISMADLRRWAARMEAMPYFCRIFSAGEGMCCGTCRISGAVPDSRSDRKIYLCRRFLSPGAGRCVSDRGNRKRDDRCGTYADVVQGLHDV